MKNNLTFIFLLLVSQTLVGQPKTEKIKVILFGTFHMRPTVDRNKTDFPDLLTEKRQLELDSIANSIYSFGVNKYFVEIIPSEQNKLDIRFLSYKQQKLKTKEELTDEIVQIVFRAAIKNNSPIRAIDFKQELPYDKMAKYENKHKDDSLSSYAFFDIKNPFTEKRKSLSKLTLKEYFIQLNSEYSQQISMYDYLHQALSYGENENYVGVGFTTSWYDRNLKIFTNILRQIDVKNDKCIFILMGASHTAILRQFFKSHPLFEIIEIEKVLK